MISKIKFFHIMLYILIFDFNFVIVSGRLIVHSNDSNYVPVSSWLQNVTIYMLQLNFMITIILGIHPTPKNLSLISHQMLLWEFYDTLFKILLGCFA